MSGALGFDLVALPPSQIASKVQEWLDTKQKLAALQERAKALQSEIMSDPEVAPHVQKGGYCSLSNLGLRVAVCAYERTSITTDTDKFGAWLDKQEAALKMACKQGKYSVNKDVYDALPVKLKRKLDKHVKHSRAAAYLSALKEARK